jgi:GTPase SAR1 family protein
MYCLEFLEANLDWLEERLRALQGYYFIFDCPGQAELYTHHTSFFKIVQALQKRLDFRLASVHLVDAHYCSDPTKFIAAALLSLTAMIRLELPHVNVLSKLDLVKAYGQPGECSEECGRPSDSRVEIGGTRAWGQLG